MENIGLSHEQVDNAQTELARVLSLASTGVHVQMFSGAIDAVWHSLIADRRSYNDFCIASSGTFVDHAPDSGSGTVAFIPSYEARFGRLPQIWFLDRHGVLDKQKWAEYTETGAVIASWECHPAMKNVKAPVLDKLLDKPIKKEEEREDIEQKNLPGKPSKKSAP